MRQKGFIQSANTEWCRPIIFAPEMNGALIFCADYYKLNVETVVDLYELARR